MSLTRLARRCGFQCLQRYPVDALTEGTVDAYFTPEGLGHNYELEVFFEGPLDHATGMIVNLAEVDALLKKVLAPLDGKHLNSEVPALKDKVPTTEVLAEYLCAALMEAKTFKEVRLVKLRLYANEDLWVDVWP